jgi:hypothetical protein
MIEMRFAHLKRILKLGRLRLRGPTRRPGRSGRHRPKSATARIASRSESAHSGSVHNTVRVASRSSGPANQNWLLSNEMADRPSPAANFSTKSAHSGSGTISDLSLLCALKWTYDDFQIPEVGYAKNSKNRTDGTSMVHSAPKLLK